MGYDGQFVHSGGEWGEQVPDSPPYLSIDIHDSDIATIDFEPGEGLFYLGTEPRDYFGSEEASDPVDHDAQAAALSKWAQEVLEKDVPADRIRPLMAEPGKESEDAFVEDTVGRLLDLLGLPRPDDLPGPA
jgi:hypothetical protein